MTQALYRRYRPESFQEVIGQEHVIQPLMAALAAGKTTHAYLFSGPRGCGKTTSARILARCLNCAQYPTGTPCGECDSCRELARDGSGSLDVVELDAASHGGVDDARELREQAGFAPVRDRFKIYIIDEAHMVSNQGFNALLKLVEEPPAHVKFIFATTEPEKVIGTIRSRTHHYPFRLVPPSTLEEYLQQLCADEGVSAGKDVLSLAVRAGTGSVRDTLSVLDQLIGGSDGTEIEYGRAVALLGYTSAHLLDEAVTAITDASGAALFGVVDSVVRSGHDPRRFVEDLLQRLRDLVIVSLAGDSAKDVFLSVPEDQYELMVSQAHALGASRASRCADLVNDALTKMVGATAPRMQLELLCARLIVASEAATARASAGGFGNRDASEESAAPEQMPSLSGHTRRSGDAVRGKVQSKPMQDPRHRPMPSFMPPVPPVDPEGASDTAAKHSASAALSDAVAESSAPSPAVSLPTSEQEETEPVRSTQEGNAPSNDMRGTHSLGDIRAQWEQIVQAASSESRIAANMLKHATGPLKYHDGTLMLGFANEGTAAGFNRQQKAQVALGHAIQQAVGVAVQIEGRAGEPAPDAHPKDDSADNDLRESSPLPEEIPPEEDPVYEIPNEQDQSDIDPAGVLAALVDGSASIRNGRAQPAASSDPTSSSDLKAPPTASASEDLAASHVDRLPEESEPEAVPFYEQDMPAPPPAELPQSLAGRYGISEPVQRSESHFRGWLGASESEQDADAASAHQELRGQLAESGALQAGESEPVSVQEFENPWDEVSDDDPEISQSSLMGVNVVLKVLGGTVTEEIPRE